MYKVAWWRCCTGGCGVGQLCRVAIFDISGYLLTAHCWPHDYLLSLCGQQFFLVTLPFSSTVPYPPDIQFAGVIMVVVAVVAVPCPVRYGPIASLPRVDGKMFPSCFQSQLFTTPIIFRRRHLHFVSSKRIIDASNGSKVAHCYTKLQGNILIGRDTK